MLSAITSDAGLRFLAPLLPTSANVLFLHRFALPDLGVEGHDPGLLRAHLEYLRRHKYDLLDLATLVARIENGTPFPNPAVVFTVDDGYLDFSAVAASVFAAYDCPVTVFLITDFVSGKVWNWWDRIPWLLEHSPRREVFLEAAGRSVAVQWRDGGERAAAAEYIVEFLKGMPDAQKEHSILSLAQSLDVSLPAEIPARDRAMSWDDVRKCARNGVTFGPHTVTHPILSQVDAERSAREIADSWQRVQSETDAAVPVFCYPNGTPRDFSTREQQSVARAGMIAALSTVEASIVRNGRNRDAVDRFAIPRFAYPDNTMALIQIASGIEALKGQRVSF